MHKLYLPILIIFLLFIWKISLYLETLRKIEKKNIYRIAYTCTLTVSLRKRVISNSETITESARSIGTEEEQGKKHVEDRNVDDLFMNNT